MHHRVTSWIYYSGFAGLLLESRCDTVLCMRTEKQIAQLDAARYKRWGNKTHNERFWGRIDTSGDCWIWTGPVNNKGYGQFFISHKGYLVHRLAYQDICGPIPEGFELDHACRNTRCCNPAHLVPVTHRENMRRSKAATKMSCKRGHDWTNPRNVQFRRDGRRWCLACQRELWGKQPKPGSGKHCSICREWGHNRRTCTHDA